MSASTQLSRPGDGGVLVSARCSIDCAPERVYSLLGDLRRHWPLLDGDLLRAEMIGAAGVSAAVLMLRVARLPIRRRVVTRVTSERVDELIAGEAWASGTHAEIVWQISPLAAGARTDVRFSVLIEPHGLRDRLLLLVTKHWLESRCRVVLGRLERQLNVEQQSAVAVAR